MLELYAMPSFAAVRSDRVEGEDAVRALVYHSRRAKASGKWQDSRWLGMQ